MEMIKETAKVVRQQQIDEGIFDMELSFPKGAALAKPGQFIAMYCNDKSKLLPRPISICGINPTEGTLRVVYRVARDSKRVSRNESRRHIRSYGASWQRVYNEK